jgi:NAD(P)-dependent dehydrogenase (short-subunit alcohol dehydrogenase family)
MGHCLAIASIRGRRSIGPVRPLPSADAPAWQADYIRRLAPLKRDRTPDDIAEAVSFLVHSTIMTVQVLVLDAGRTLAS